MRDLTNRRETGNFIENFGCLMIALVVVLGLILGLIIGALFGTYIALSVRLGCRELLFSETR